MSKEDELKNLREKEENNEGLWSGLSPEEFLEQMFIRTDADGILYVPGFNASTAFCAEDFSYRCKMKWSYSDYERVLREYHEIVTMLNDLRAKEDRLGRPLAEHLDVLSEAERRFWNTYLRPFSNADDWESGIADISECVDIVDDVRILSEKRGKGESLTDIERSYLRDYLDVSVSPEEKKALQRFYDIRIREAEQRVGSNIDAYNLIVRVRRVNRLHKLEAPQIIIEREATGLIETLALHRCGVRAENISDLVRLRSELSDYLPDDVLDAYTDRVNANTRKSLAPLFIYLLLKERTSEGHSMKQREILTALADRPYEIVLERKTLGRILHNLANSNLGVRTDTKRGSWFEQ